MTEAKDIAKYIISVFQTIPTNEIEGDLTNLKLQKLLYYIQVDFLKIFNKLAFSNTIEAWKYGPVIPDVYYNYNSYGRNVITIKHPVFSLKSPQLKITTDKVIEDKGQYTGIALMRMTHKEQPWKTAKEQPDKIITEEMMKTATLC